MGRKGGAAIRRGEEGVGAFGVFCLVTLFTRNVNSTFKAKRYREPAKTKLGYKIRTATGKARYVIDNDTRRLNHVSLSGGPLRAEFSYSDEAILISHPRLGLEITLYQ